MLGRPEILKKQRNRKEKKEKIETKENKNLEKSTEKSGV
jgi:hypothetical protein